MLHASLLDDANTTLNILSFHLVFPASVHSFTLSQSLFVYNICLPIPLGHNTAGSVGGVPSISGDFPFHAVSDTSITAKLNLRYGGGREERWQSPALLSTTNAIPVSQPSKIEQCRTLPTSFVTSRES